MVSTRFSALCLIRLRLALAFMLWMTLSYTTRSDATLRLVKYYNILGHDIGRYFFSVYVFRRLKPVFVDVI